MRLKGQDTIVVLLLEDGTEVVCPNIQSAMWTLTPASPAST
jgi:hypothetical protein